MLAPEKKTFTHKCPDCGKVWEREYLEFARPPYLRQCGECVEKAEAELKRKKEILQKAYYRHEGRR